MILVHITKLNLEMWINLLTFVYNYQLMMSLYILTYLKRSKINSKKQSPLFMRITIDGVRSEIALKRFVDSELWDNVKQCVKGKSEMAKSINEQIEGYKIVLHNHHTRLLKNNEKITAHSLKAAFIGLEEKGKSLMEAFEYHNSKLKEQIGKGFAVATYNRYETTLKIIKEFIKVRYNLDDISLSEINLEFITEMEYHLKIIRGCNNNTSVKYIKNFQKIVNLAISYSWLDNNPFKNYKCKIHVVDREFLQQHELDLLRNKELHTVRLDQVRDVFLFCCFTGLAYSDVEKLSNDNVILGIDGSNWIQINRTKTNALSKIPILPMAQDILNKYIDNPFCIKSDKLLPVSSNQRTNAYLKEIADLCKINKKLTCHVARHTFATTITLQNGIPIETVSKMLGHKSIRTTQHYSKVLDLKVSEEMNSIREKFSNNSSAIKVAIESI